jgi:hypothetical protein
LYCAPIFPINAMMRSSPAYSRKNNLVTAFSGQCPYENVDRT